MSGGKLAHVSCGVTTKGKNINDDMLQLTFHFCGAEEKTFPPIKRSDLQNVFNEFDYTKASFPVANWKDGYNPFGRKKVNKKIEEYVMTFLESNKCVFDDVTSEVNPHLDAKENIR